MRSHRRWSELAVSFMQTLWRCPCQYSNVATSRCYGCGSRPPRAMREAVAAKVAAEVAAEVAADRQRVVAVPGA